MEKKAKNQFRQKVEKADKISRRIITIGGYGIVLCIVLILIFLIYQSLPLAKGADIDDWLTIRGGTPKDQTILTGIDPYLQVFYEMTQEGFIDFYNIKSKQIVHRDTIPLAPNEKILSASKAVFGKELFAVGTDSGRIITASITMDPSYKNFKRVIVPKFEFDDSFHIATENDTMPKHVEKLQFGEDEDGSEIWAWVDHGGSLWLRIKDADYGDIYTHDLTQDINREVVTAMTMSNNAENLVVTTDTKNVFWFDLTDFEKITIKDRWRTNELVSAVKYLLGDQTLIIGGVDGSVTGWLPVRTPANLFKYRQVFTFKSHPAVVNHIFVSSRKRNFLTTDIRGNVKLHYSTTGKTQAEFKPVDTPVKTGTFSPKADAILLVNTKKDFSLFKLDDPHPEATFGSLFGKVWYEGYNKPELVWQSTGGSDEFEPKFSLIPLIFGTFKGTLFAMLFSVPLAIFAAIYVSQFAPLNLSRRIKPTLEIMAALPSVVIGFLAGLYFSPFFEKYLMTIFLSAILLPVFFYLALIAWKKIQAGRQKKWPPGIEILFALPVLAITVLIALGLGHPFEQWLFNGSFQKWLYATFQVTYETRNSIVVGFALGFAVIPIIFTVAEDAISNVPGSLSSASLALGASRWQTVKKVILPAASGGIFAAIMLGLGRAVGETMIVLMATGNTPIIDLNPFNGFRAMSACIAVEIPEAPVGDTLYRILFLTGLLLFIFTFILNTVSSLIGDRLRKKYARF